MKAPTGRSICINLHKPSELPLDRRAIRTWICAALSNLPIPIAITTFCTWNSFQFPTDWNWTSKCDPALHTHRHTDTHTDTHTHTHTHTHTNAHTDTPALTQGALCKFATGWQFVWIFGFLNDGFTMNYRSVRERERLSYEWASTRLCTRPKVPQKKNHRTENTPIMQMTCKFDCSYQSN